MNFELVGCYLLKITDHNNHNEDCFKSYKNDKTNLLLSTKKAEEKFGWFSNIMIYGKLAITRGILNIPLVTFSFPS